MHAAGSTANFIYAKLDIKQFKTVNTIRGPWALLEGLENVEDNPSRTIKPHKDAKTSLEHLEALSHAAMAQPLHKILDIVRKVAIGLIGSDNLEGRICIWQTLCNYLHTSQIISEPHVVYNMPLGV